MNTKESSFLFFCPSIASPHQHITLLNTLALAAAVLLKVLPLQKVLTASNQLSPPAIINLKSLSRHPVLRPF